MTAWTAKLMLVFFAPQAVQRRRFSMPGIGVERGSRTHEQQNAGAGNVCQHANADRGYGKPGQAAALKPEDPNHVAELIQPVM